ncbi:uncharacterized protein isoform X2 [Leptinotarsa decemlineata]|uniref:uncharacterized protein isoform X2 n=1 Tax=Leptinotarsa decemlineata TaxID=7539 RepID=UPI003D3087A7
MPCIVSIVLLMMSQSNIVTEINESKLFVTNYMLKIQCFQVNTTDITSYSYKDLSSDQIPESERILQCSKGSISTSVGTNGTVDSSQLTQKEETVEKTKKGHYKDKRTFCFYCEKDVYHFPRHLSTWHENEIEVQRIFSYESRSKERRGALSALAKRGNFLKNRTSTQLRPVKRVSGFQASTVDFLPCPHCFGFYKKNSLYRHTKQCNSTTSVVNVKRQSSQSDGQTALLMGIYFQHEELLKKELFPRMRADDITLTAKKDILICNYAYSYMKGRRSKGNLDLVRQNMRRLAKLLQYAKEINGEINEFIETHIISSHRQWSQ